MKVIYKLKKINSLIITIKKLNVSYDNIILLYEKTYSI